VVDFDGGDGGGDAKGFCVDGDTEDIVGLAEEATDSTEKGGGAVSIGGGVGVDCEVRDDGGDAETNGFGGHLATGAEG
jgi:hypothetical protein